MYSSGATTFPVWPTCNELSAYPASTAARDAPIAAPNASANGSRVALKVLASFNARPPDTMRLAEPSSGRSDLVSSVLICSEAGLETSTGSTAFASTSEPSADAALKAVERTVKNLSGMEELARTVAMALPAYIGRVNVVLFDELSCSREVISETAGTSNFAATRGSRDFADAECAETTCVNGEPSERIFSSRGDTVSGNGGAYFGDEACNSPVNPFNLFH